MLHILAGLRLLTSDETRMREGGRVPAEASAKEGAYARRRPALAAGVVPEPVEGRKGRTTFLNALTNESAVVHC